MYDLVKDLHIKFFMQSNLIFPRNVILLCFLSFFLIIGLYCLILTIFAQVFNPIVELIIPEEILTKEAKAEMGIHPATTKMKVRKCSM